MNQEWEKPLNSSDLPLAPLGLEGPTGRSYWVVEGRLLAGAYPGKKGSGHMGGNVEETQKLIAAGVNVFINLTKDQTGQGNNDSKLVQYDEDVAGQAVVERYPVQDVGIPTEDEMLVVLDAIDGHLANGKTVYFHCWGGFGRTGTVLGCWLRRHGHATNTSWQELINDLRLGAVDAQHRPSPEVAGQCQFVDDWPEGELVAVVPEKDALSAPQVDRTDRMVGSMLAGAVGDALGATLEFMSLSEIEDQFGVGGSTTFIPYHEHPASITDDTQMSLFTAEGLIEAAKHGTDPVDEVWKAYQRWYHTQGGPLPEGIAPDFGLLAVPELHQRRAPGYTCMSSMEGGIKGTINAPINDSKGCGGIMRVGPVGLIATNSQEAYRIGCDVAALTHTHRNGWIPAGVQAVIIHRIMEGDDLFAAVLAGREMAEQDPLGGEVVACIDAAIALSAEAPLGGWDLHKLGGAWVGEEALAITIAVVLAEDDINKALLLAVNHSGDSDSTGAMVGNVLGALHGTKTLKASWQQEVEIADVIIGLAERTAEVTMSSDIPFEGINSETSIELRIPVKSLPLEYRTQTCLERANVETLEQLVAMTGPELMALRNFGQISLDDVVACLDELGLSLSSVSRPRPPARLHPVFDPSAGGFSSATLPTGGLDSELVDAFVEMAAWGVGTLGVSSFAQLFEQLAKIEGLNSHPTFPQWVSDALSKENLDEVAEGTGSNYDGRKLLTRWELTVRHDEGGAAVLDKRIAVVNREDSKSYRAIGDELGITAEAARRRCKRVLGSLDETCENPIVAQRAKQSISMVGQAVPLKDLLAAGIDVSDATDRLLLVAGARLLGFERQTQGIYFQKKIFSGDEWLVTVNPEGQEDLVLRAMGCFANEASVSVEELTQSVAKMLGEALSFEDRCGLAQRLVEDCKSLRCLGGEVLLWTGSYGDKAVRILEANGEPMHRDELAEAVEPTSLRGVINSFQEDERVMAVGLQMYGLAVWGLEGYINIVHHMVEILEREGGGPVSLNALSTELSERFSIEGSSVQIYASTDPHFIEKEGSVTLRDDFSDVELPPLGETFGIVRMGKGLFAGRWALRIEVSADHLRGSGTPIPAGFARHVGAEFGETVLLETNEGPVSCSWQKNRGSLSSIGAMLQRWEAKEGDLIFLTSVSPSQAYFEHVKNSELPVDEEQRLRILLGTDLAVGINDALAQAVGLSEGVDMAVLMTALEERVRRHQSKEVSALIKSWAQHAAQMGQS